MGPEKKEIKKVVEARMRKRKRAAVKLLHAKKKALTMVDSPELSGRSKLKVPSLPALTYIVHHVKWFTAAGDK
jgi:hypothetical protein